MMTPIILQVPDCLGSSAEELEQLFALFNQAKTGQPLGLDMARVNWIKPAGLLSLLSFARYATPLTHHKVCLFGCQRDVIAYLVRVNFFDSCCSWAYTTDKVLESDELARSKSSKNLLELRPIRSSDDVDIMADRTDGILKEWLAYGSREQNDLVSILAEMCENIIEHSKDPEGGHVAIQRYRRPGLQSTEVRIAVGDMGIGIRRSLEPAHGSFGASAADYIRGALDGMSARGENKGGNGYRKVQEIIRRANGTLHVHSENGAVAVSNRSADLRLFPTLSFVPGTQISIRLIQRTT